MCLNCTDADSQECCHVYTVLCSKIISICGSVPNEYFFYRKLLFSFLQFSCENSCVLMGCNIGGPPLYL
jgi:hypothetical protein